MIDDKIREVLEKRISLHLDDAYDSIFEYIESWYKRKRIHSSLNYMTPEAVHSVATYVA